MFSHLPEFVHGIDIAGYSTTNKAFPVAISVVTVDVASLQIVGCVSVFMDHNDEEAKQHFDFSDSTFSWWRGWADNSPSQEAFDLTFKAEHQVIIPEGLKTISAYMAQWKNKKCVIASKSPTYDLNALTHACNVCNVGISSIGYHTLIDNAHTAQRCLSFLNCTPDLSKESISWTKGKPFIPHYVPHEAGESGYVTARLYHSLYLLSKGPNLLKEANDLMVEGKYNFPEFSRKHKELFAKDK